MVIKGHSTPIFYLSKTSDSLLISSALDPDYTLKVWDLATLVEKSGSEIKNNVILLVAELKGHNS
jgi:hypothetical protein